jgi:hypothetical protein
MWVRKSRAEQKSKKKYYTRYVYVMCFIVFFLLIFFLSKINGEWHAYQLGDAPGPLSWKETITYIPKYLVTSAILTLGMYLLVKAIDKNDKGNSKKFVCDKCDTFAEDKGLCKCGGKFIDIELLKWVDDK